MTSTIATPPRLARTSGFAAIMKLDDETKKQGRGIELYEYYDDGNDWDGGERGSERYSFELAGGGGDEAPKPEKPRRVTMLRVMSALRRPPSKSTSQ